MKTSVKTLKEYLPSDKHGNIPFNLYDAKTIDGYLKLIINPLNDSSVRNSFVAWRINSIPVSI